MRMAASTSRVALLRWPKGNHMALVIFNMHKVSALRSVSSLAVRGEFAAPNHLIGCRGKRNEVQEPLNPTVLLCIVYSNEIHRLLPLLAHKNCSGNRIRRTTITPLHRITTSKIARRVDVIDAAASAMQRSVRKARLGAAVLSCRVRTNDPDGFVTLRTVSTLRESFGDR